MFFEYYIEACGCMHTQSCQTPCDPMDWSRSGSSVHEIFQARIEVGLPFPSPRDLHDPGIKPMSPVSATLAGRFLTTEQTLYHWAPRNPYNKACTFLQIFYLKYWTLLGMPENKGQRLQAFHRETIQTFNKFMTRCLNFLFIKTNIKTVVNCCFLSPLRIC